MNVRVELQWSDSDPSIRLSEADDGLVAFIDPRLSQCQVQAACLEFEQAGDLVWQRWQEAVGLSEQGDPAR